MSHSLSALHGNIKDLRFPRILATLERDGFTGVIQVTTPAGDTDPDGHPATTTREVHLAGGHIAWAISTDRQESLRSFLDRDRTITDSQWNAAEERAREGSLREALSSLGLVSARELSEIEAARAKAIVLELFSMQEGEYRVRERQLSPGTPDLEIAVRPLLLKGVAERAERDFALEEVGSLDAVFSMSKNAIEGSALAGEYASIAGQLDGKRSIAGVCSETGLPDNFVLSIVAGLSLAGLLERGTAAAAGERRAVRVVPAAPEEEALEEQAVSVDEQEDDTEETEEDEEPILEAIEVIEEQPLEAVGADADEQDLLDEDRFDPVQDERLLDDIDVEEIRRSIYGEGARDASARRWLLAGGAAAVGFVALILILAAQNRGDAGELTTLSSPATAASVPEEEFGDTVPAIEDEYPEEEDSAPLEWDPQPPARREEPGGAVAGHGESPILSEDGREDEAGGSSGRSDRSASARSGDFTIKILTACQEGTVERAIARAGHARDLFTLPAEIDGRSCQRLYWGSYATRDQAQHALRRDIPAFFRNDRNPPAIVAMP